MIYIMSYWFFLYMQAHQSRILTDVLLSFIFELEAKKQHAQ